DDEYGCVLSNQRDTCNNSRSSPGGSLFRTSNVLVVCRSSTQINNGRKSIHVNTIDDSRRSKTDAQRNLRLKSHYEFSYFFVLTVLVADAGPYLPSSPIALTWNV